MNRTLLRHIAKRVNLSPPVGGRKVDRRKVDGRKTRFLFFLLGAWLVFAPSVHAQDQTLTGWFTFIVADYLPETGLTADIETTYRLTEDSGKRHELLLDSDLMRPLGGPVALNRQRVTVEGAWVPGGAGGPAPFQVRSIRLAAPPSARSAALRTAAAATLTGPQRWVTILCRFGDAKNVTPRPRSHYEKLMASAYPGLDHYWKEVSYGTIDLTGSVVVGWYDLPRPRSYYVLKHEGGGETSDLDRMTADCTAAADADVVFPNFSGINLIFNQELDGAAQGGMDFLTLDGSMREWGITWLPGVTYERPDILAHEMGHGFGLLHSSGPYMEAYDSAWDVMSGGHSFLQYPGYGHLGVHTIAYHKDFLGWMPADRKYTATRNTTRTLTLERLARPGSEHYLMAQIPIGDSTTNFYTVEARRFAGYDGEVPAEAVVIHKVDTTRDDRLAQIVDPDNNGDPNDEGARWTVGEVFTDPANGLQVSVDAALASGFRVTVNTNPDTFTTCITFLSASRHVFGPGSDRADVQLTAASDCRWSATSNASWLRVTSGSSGSGPGQVGYALTANPGSGTRTGTLSISGWTLTVTQAGADAVLFADDMEQGAGSWTEDSWPLSTDAARSGRYARTDSPGGDYPNDQLSILESPVIDLTRAASATLTFWQRYAFGSGDRGEVWVEHRDKEGVWQSRGRDPIRLFTGTRTNWEQVTVNLNRFVGERLRLSFHVVTDTTGTADGWYIDDVAVFSSDFAPPASTPAALENPQPASFQSGVGVISGWACEAGAVTIELNGVSYRAGSGTPRADTRSVCGDTDNGFSLLWNWNNLGPGTHTVRALLNGVEFARTGVTVTTFGEPFLRGVTGEFPLTDFPRAGQTTRIRWQEALQNFVITDGQPGPSGGHSRVAGLRAVLENPALGSTQSGIGVISGWACEAKPVTIELNGVSYRAASGTPRADTRSVCGDTDNGFSLLWNWNNLGPGTHTVRALLNGVEFANTRVTVTTFGEPFLRGVAGMFPLSNFPRAGQTTRVRWEQSLQNFVIIPLGGATGQ